MQQVPSILERIESKLCGLLAGVLTLLIFVAVVLRYGFNNPIGWSDELASLLFTWLVFLGAAAGMGRRAHIGIDTLVQCLPPTARRAVDATVDLLLVIILGILIYYGVLLCAMTAQVTTPSLGIPVALVYGAAPVGAILMLLHHAHRLATTYLPRRTDVTASRQARG